MPPNTSQQQLTHILFTLWPSLWLPGSRGLLFATAELHQVQRGPDFVAP